LAKGEKDLTDLFLHHAMDRMSYLEVLETGRIVEANVPVMPYPDLRDGEGVRITRGPLMDLEGILVRSNPQQGDVDGTRVEAA
jgi:hypothetical protein